ncbi:hypothetical protein AOC36_03450 [Erysipelothrix larvae]|uniref:SHSP domain-containing protein n=1 Tax=Erysipelothrix larvae TaxID=1514105 RepID=A0A0X8GZ67_9FIRM|nr:Hsp20 family protein [Erysipelothrix larvae]AMC93064.1 hypothetical protein AOC36_03450 [Erysipelothrix larvae]
MRNQVTRRPQNLIESFFNDDVFSNFTYGKDIDIYRKDNAFVVEADIPGFDKEDISLDFKGDILTISAERNEEVEDTSKKNYYYRSRQVKRFNRQIRFSDVNAHEINASYDNGVLKITLPIIHQETADTRKIEVK